MIKGWASAAGDTSEEGAGEQEGGILDVVGWDREQEGGILDVIGWDRELGSSQRPWRHVGPEEGDWTEEKGVGQNRAQE